MVRSDLENRLHRMANGIETQLADIFRELLAESRVSAVSSIAWSSARFIEALRSVRDGEESEGE